MYKKENCVSSGFLHKIWGLLGVLSGGIQGTLGAEVAES